MFSFNSGQGLPKLSEVHQFWSFDPKGKLVIEFLSSLPKITPSLDDTRLEDIQLPRCGPIENINPDHAPADRFMDGNNERLLDFSFPQLNDLYGGRESKGLPPDFVGNLCLNRIFTEPWEDADLTHALTGLDYLTNLECTRRTALREAAQRLRINEDNWRSVLADNNEARAWICLIQEQEDIIELCYSCLWVDLRIWTMVKELRSEPFYKPNIIAMLNTLFPPVIKELPSLRISDKVLHKHRNTFYRYVVSIDVGGKSVLDDFIEKINRPGTSHTWSDTRQTLKDYIKLADTMIKQASQVHGISFFKNSLGEHLPLRSTIVSGTSSSHSDLVSMNSRSTKPSRGELKRVPTRTSGHRESTESAENAEYTENAGSLRGSMKSKDSPGSPDSKFILPTRSRFSGKRTGQRITSQDDIDTLFQDSPQAPWYSSPRRPSSASGHSPKTSYSGGRLHSSFSRPLTPSIEEQRVHRRSLSVSKRISYEFRNMLPGTPELPSPQANEKQSVSKVPAASQATISLETDAIIQKQHESEPLLTKKKIIGFKLFRRKKKPDSLSDSKPAISILQDECSQIDSSSNPDNSKEGLRQPADRLFVPEKQTLKMKSSFRFLQRRKSHEDGRVVSDSNYDRTVIENTSQKVKPKRSLTNLIANKGAIASGLGIDTSENSRDTTNTTGSIFGLRQTIRKARSFSSVKSASSIYSNEGAKNPPSSSLSSMIDEDRIITSADIAEPFPFGNFVQPQTPAILFEDPEECKYNEDIRSALLEKARKERMAKWEQSEEFKRKLEASRLKRRVLREEMDANVQASKNARQKRKEEDDKKRAKQALMNATPKTPKPVAHDSEKPPKTPMKVKELFIREIASAYSPKSPSLT